jgi:hypothetical protein
MDRWDTLLLIAAGYIAVVSLVRLMVNRRNELVAKVREEIVKQRATAAQAAEQAEQNQDAA